MTALAHLGGFVAEVVGYGLACIAVFALVVYDRVRRRSGSR